MTQEMDPCLLDETLLSVTVMFIERIDVKE